MLLAYIHLGGMCRCGHDPLCQGTRLHIKAYPKLNKTPEEIKDAVRVVGNSAAKVREHFGRRWQISL